MISPGLGWGGPGYIGFHYVFPVIDESHLHNVATINFGYFWPFLMIIDNGYYLVISPLCPYSFKLVLLEIQVFCFFFDIQLT